MENEPGTRLILPAENVRSLCFRGDTLVDFVTGRIFHLNGDTEDLPVRFDNEEGMRFDAATVSPSGRFAAVYERSGLNAVLLKGNAILRRLTRDKYRAENTSYPLCLFTLPDAREVIAHCPEEYNRLEIEDVYTGERLTAPAEENSDVFYSRLATNPSGTLLLSAGWVWSPVEVVDILDVEMLLSRDRPPGVPWDVAGLLHVGYGGDEDPEVTTAAFLDNDRVVVLQAKYEASNGIIFGEPEIAVYQVNQEAALSVAPLDDGDTITSNISNAPTTSGNKLMPVGDEWVIHFADCPKLVHIASGKAVYQWKNIPTGGKQHSYTWPPPPWPLSFTALDPARRRFAVAGPDTITVVTVTPPDAPPAVAATAIQ